MNFKTFGATLLAAGAVAGTTFASAPAQAASLTGTLSFGADVRIDNLDAPKTFTFLDASGAAAGTNFAVSTDSTDLAFNTPAPGKVGGTPIGSEIYGTIVPSITLDVAGQGGKVGPIANFLSGLTIRNAADTANIPLRFDLAEFKLELLNKTVFGPATNYSYISSITGRFFAGSEFAGFGSFTSQFTVIGNGSTRNVKTTYSGNIAALPIPTPALLPGLIALGVGALRKRNSEALEAAEADA